MIIERDGRERGAILLGVLAFVSVVSTLTVAMIEDVRRSAHESGLVENSLQGFWYAVGVEEMTAGILERSRRVNKGRDSANDAWLRAPMRFPIEGGLIEASISDGGNCLNVNALVVGDAGARLQSRPHMIAEMARLMTLLDATPDRAERIAAALADYIDSDARTAPGGAEDSVYLERPAPSRTPGTLLADISEIRAVEGMDAGLYRVLAPLLCALPTTEANRLNINTLRLQQAPLLAAVIGGDFRPEQAAVIIRDRPTAGYGSRAAIFDLPLLRQRSLPKETEARLDIVTDYYRLAARIQYQESDLAIETLFVAGADGGLRRLKRHFGSDI